MWSWPNNLAYPGPQWPSVQNGNKRGPPHLLNLRMGGGAKQDCVAITAVSGNTTLSFHGILLSPPPYLYIYLPPPPALQAGVQIGGSALKDPIQQHTRTHLLPSFLASPPLSLLLGPHFPNTKSTRALLSALNFKSRVNVKLQPFRLGQSAGIQARRPRGADTKGSRNAISRGTPAMDVPAKFCQLNS